MSINLKAAAIGPDTTESRRFLDPVTSLPRGDFLDRLLSGDGSLGAPPEAVIVIELTRLRAIDAAFGRSAMNSLLRIAAQRIGSAVRDGDIIIRSGSEEFTILQTSGEQPKAALAAADRMIELLRRAFLVEGRQLNIQAAAGIATASREANIGQLHQRARLALQEAHAAGGDTCRLYAPSLRQRAHERQALETKLRRALTLRELSLAYQPQYDLRSRTIVGFEALLRWNNNDGPVSPADFIPLAEEIGEIRQIGAWVMRTACKDAAQLNDGLTVAVNVSPIQLHDDEIVRVIERELKSSGLEPPRLVVEITESVFLDDGGRALERLAAIKDLGVAIAMDDFGTGYSSLSFLSSFPFSKLKIDQSFVRRELTPKAVALLQAMVALGKALGMETIAEGVETEEQLRRLEREGFAVVQGYLIGRPMNSDRIAHFLTDFRQSEGKWQKA